MMASVETAAPPANGKTKQKKYDEWEVRDAMHTMMRAGKIVKILTGLDRTHGAILCRTIKKVLRPRRGSSIQQKHLNMDGAEARGILQSLDTLAYMFCFHLRSATVANRHSCLPQYLFK